MRAAWAFCLPRAVLALAVLAGPAPAQAPVGPAEPPPADFAADRYVDSTGCAFMRASQGGTLAWVPHLGADRKPVCDLPPSFPPLRLIEVQTVVEPPGTCPEGTTQAQRFVLSDGRTILHCGAAVEDPAAFLNAAKLPGIVVMADDPSPDAGAGTAGAQATGADAAGDAPAAADAPELRPETPAEPTEQPEEATEPEPAPPPAPEPPAKPLPEQPPDPPATAATGAYVQVGAFGKPENARKVETALEDLGFPVTVLEGSLTVVLAGPFVDPDKVREALRVLKGAGFPEAFVR
jgi:cell division septation protein DedD